MTIWINQSDQSTIFSDSASEDGGLMTGRLEIVTSDEPESYSTIGLLVRGENTLTSGSYNARYNYTQTGTLASGFSINVGVISDFRNIDGGQGLASWLVAATPQNATTSYGVYCEEVNVINRGSDSGYSKKRSTLSRWTGGIQIVPESRDIVDGGDTNCYNVTYSLAVCKSGTTKADGDYAKSYNGVLIEADSIAPAGRGVLASGDSTDDAAKLPNYAIEIDNNWASGIYTVDATFTDNNAITLDSGQNIKFGTGTYPVSISGNDVTGYLSVLVEGQENVRVIRGAASVVNYVTLAGNATSGGAKVYSSGSDTNVNLFIYGQGTGYVVLGGQTGTTGSLRVDPVANLVNQLQVYGGATNNPVSIVAIGTDSNIDVAITPKGTGVIKFGNTSAAASNAANFTADRYLAMKDGSGNVYYIPIRTNTW